jgi:hypothetical protein
VPDKILQPRGLPNNRMGIKITPELMGMYMQALELQRSGDKKKKVKRGLQSKLGDPQSSLDSEEKALLNIMLKTDQIGGRTNESALVGLRAKFPGKF